MNRREKIEHIIKSLDRISNDYTCFEIALLIFLRSDLFTFKNYITDSDIEKLEYLIDNCSSLLDINKEDIDYIIEGEEDNE